MLYVSLNDRPLFLLWLARISPKFFPCKYLILVMTDNVVSPPDGFYAVITSAPPSVALWIIQDYVVIPLILIALRFQSKYGNSTAAVGSGEVLAGVTVGPSLLPFRFLFTLPSLAVLVNNLMPCFLFPLRQLPVYSVTFSNHHSVKTKVASNCVMFELIL